MGEWNLTKFKQHQMSEGAFCILVCVCVFFMNYHPGNQFNDSKTTCIKVLGIWPGLAVHGFVVFHHCPKLPCELNCKAFHVVTRSNTI